MKTHQRHIQNSGRAASSGPNGIAVMPPASAKEEQTGSKSGLDLSVLQRATNPSYVSEVPSLVDEALRSPSQPLDAEMRAFMEPRFGQDFSGVRVHTDGKAADSARSVDALAYTVGHNIVFGDNQYAPRTDSGRRLIAHELAHITHGMQATEQRAGIAPAESRAEQFADRTADRVIGQNSGFRPLFSTSFMEWGPAWATHRQVTKSTKKGSTQHTGEVGRAPGEIGVPYGWVEVRTGEEIELKGGTKLPNMIAIEYKGLFSPNSKWLQFVWFEMTATTSKGLARLSGSIPTSSGTKPFTTNPKAPNWSVDSASTSDPFYEAGFANIRDKSSTTVFDAPGGGSAAPLANSVFSAGIGANSVTFTAHFETYLIENDQAAYVVSWQASTAFTQVKGSTVAGAIGYTVGSSGQQNGLPKDRKTLLHSSYSKFKHVK